MQIEMWAVDRPRPFDRNPRFNDRAVEPVARALREFGFRQPIVVDRDGVIVVGHTRWRAAKSIGMTEVPVHVAADLTAEQASAYRLADNHLATLAEWDNPALAQLLGELPTELVAASGFAENYLNELLEELKGPAAPADFKQVDESVACEHECPRCHFRWSGGQPAGSAEA